MLEIYQKVGKIIEISQYIEWNLALLIRLRTVLRAFDKNGTLPVDRYAAIEEQAKVFNVEMQNMTLGEIIGVVRTANIFAEDILSLLRKALGDRNDVVHKLFKQIDTARLKEAEYVNRIFTYLNGVLENMYRVNNLVADVTEKDRRLYLSIK